MRKFLAFFLIFSFNFASACDCPPVRPLSKELCGGFNVIFRGKVTSVTPCDEKGNAVASFAITALYKGNCEKEIQVNFECMSSCMMSFAPGEEWIIYAN